MEKDASTGWELPGHPEADQPGPGRTEADFKKREELVKQISQKAALNGWSKAEAARRIDMASGTFHQWFSGKYAGRLDAQNEKVMQFLASSETMTRLANSIPKSPPFIETKFARDVMNMLTAAKIMPAMVMVSAEAGIGKTATARHYKARTPNTFMVTISPHTKTVHGTLLAIAEALDIHQPNQAKIVSAIGKRIERIGDGTLIIVDEGQNLIDESMNQLRHFVDMYGCGIALLGNSETYTRFHKTWSDGPHYGQLKRRIYKRMNVEKPHLEDLTAFIHACDIAEPEMVRFLTGVGLKPGALGQVDMTVKLAKMSAAGSDQPLSIGHLKAAWQSRDVGALA